MPMTYGYYYIMFCLVRCYVMLRFLRHLCSHWVSYGENNGNLVSGWNGCGGRFGGSENCKTVCISGVAHPCMLQWTSLLPASSPSPKPCLLPLLHPASLSLWFIFHPTPSKLKPRTSKNTHTSNSGKKRRCSAWGGWGGGQNVVDPTNQQTAVVKKKKRLKTPHL